MSRRRWELLFNLLADRYEQRSTLVTTNLSFSEWVQVFGDEKLTTALLEHLLRTASLAAHRAKVNGGGQCLVMDEGTTGDSRERLQLEVELRRALKRSQFALVYQPLVRLETGELEGVEALVRWDHPRRGRLLSSAFIDVAEASGLVVPLGQWVREEACHRLAHWGEGAGGQRKLNLNLSAVEFQSLKLPRAVACCLAETGVNPEAVTLEITETAMMQDADRAREIVRSLRQIGVGVVLDDFGTGYSSLNYLRQLPVSGLKLDRSFIQEMLTDLRTRKVLQSVIRLAVELDLEVTAEGVETAEQAKLLREVGCHHGQGFHFSEPLEERELVNLFGAQCSASIL